MSTWHWLIMLALALLAFGGKGKIRNAMRSITANNGSVTTRLVHNPLAASIVLSLVLCTLMILLGAIKWALTP